MPELISGYRYEVLDDDTFDPLFTAYRPLVFANTATFNPRAHYSVISGADSFVEIEQYAQGKRAWLERFLELENGIPSHDTFRRVFMLLDAEAWQGVFFNWTRKLTLAETASPTEVLAVDGKWSRSSGLHTVSVWASEQQVVLSQQQVADKTNEITVMPELLEVLDLAGTTVTIDAGHAKADCLGDSGTSCRLRFSS